MPGKTKQKQKAKVRKEAVKVVETALAVARPKAPRPSPVRSPVIHGKGGFWGDVWDGVKKGANFVADNVPKAIGLAKTLAPLLSGFGAYHVKRNSLMQAAMPRRMRGALSSGYTTESGFPTVSPPVFANGGAGSDCIISHSEFVANVQSSINFQKTTYLVNAGNPALFPWFSQMAALYEEYEILGMVFEYRPTSAKAVGTVSSAMGVVLMASDYDCYDDSFTSKRAAEAAEYCTPGAPYEHLVHPVECDRSRNVLGKEYIVPGATLVSQLPGDARMSAYCLTSIITEGQQVDNTAIGELHVSYHIRLSRPILEGVQTSNYSQHVTLSANNTGITSIDSNRVVGSGFAVTQAAVGFRTITFTVPDNSPRIGGRYLVTALGTSPSSVTWDGGSFAVPSTFGGAHFEPLLRNNTAWVRNSTGSSSLYSGWSGVTQVAVVTITGNGQGFTMNTPASSDASTITDVFITPMSAALTSDARVGRILATVQSTRLDAQVETLRTELALMREQMRANADEYSSAAARAAGKSQITDVTDSDDAYEDVDPDEIALKEWRAGDDPEVAKLRREADSLREAAAKIQRGIELREAAKQSLEDRPYSGPPPVKSTEAAKTAK